jgi:SAM-dependent methyltransferase
LAPICNDILKAIGSRIAFGEATRVLDFGCGCGRVLAYLRREIAGELTGSDIDGEAIAWSQENLMQVGTFVCNEIMPPLPFPDATFDLTYAVSVFTHLPRRMESAWLRELTRVTKPGGYLLLTTNGTHSLQLNRFRRLQFAVLGHLYLKAHTPGLPTFYRSTFHSEDYVRRRWNRFFDIVEFQPKGLNSDQNLILGRVRE